MLSWVVVVPVKRLDVAKSRLSPQLGPHRRELALAMALDTVEVASSCAGVRTIVVTNDDLVGRELEALDVTVIAHEPSGGINAALLHGLGATALRAGEGVAALTADLPALRASELALALSRAGGAQQSFVPDAEGTGTTLYASRRPATFDPGFGVGSAARHAARARTIDVTSLVGLRRDVDTIDDLRTAVDIGVGPRTRMVVAELEGFDLLLMPSAS